MPDWIERVDSLAKKGAWHAQRDLEKWIEDEPGLPQLILDALQSEELILEAKQTGDRFRLFSLYDFLREHVDKIESPTMFVRDLEHEIRAVRVHAARTLARGWPDTARQHARERLDGRMVSAREIAVILFEALDDVSDLEALETRYEKESSKTVKPMLESLIARLRARDEASQVEEFSPEPPGTLSESEREIEKKLSIWLSLRPDVLFGSDELAAIVGCEPDQVDPLLSEARQKLEEGDTPEGTAAWYLTRALRRYPAGGARNESELQAFASGWRVRTFRERKSEPDLALVDQLAARAEDEKLSRYLVGSAKIDGAPALVWKSGDEVGDALTRWYVENVLVDELRARIVERNFTEDSRFELALWLLESGRVSKISRPWAGLPFAGDRLIREVARRWEAEKRGKRPWTMRGINRPLFRRICYRWWLEQRGVAWPQEMFQGDPRRHIDMDFPVEADESGDLDWWRARIVGILEHSMATGRVFGGWRLRIFWLEHPIARTCMKDVVFRLDDVFARWSGEDFETGDGIVELDDQMKVRVAHPAEGTEDWPDGSEAPFPQRERRIYGLDELPQQPWPEIPNSMWVRRLSALGLAQSMDSHGSYDYAYGPGWGTENVRIRHSNWGHGYGGKRPVTIEGASIQGLGKLENLEPAPRSEVVSVVRKLLGIDDLSASGDEAEKHFAKGARVRIVGGNENVGELGEIFWWGKSKFGDGMRAGVNTDAGATIWLDEDDLGWPED